MKPFYERRKPNFKIRPTNEKGSVTLFVLIAMLFFLTIGIIIFITNVNTNTAQQKDIKKIKSEYSNVENAQLDQIYEQQEQKVAGRIQIIARDSEGNAYREGTWTNNEPLTLEVIWPTEISSNDRKIVVMHGLQTEYRENEIQNISLTENGTYNIFCKLNENEAQLVVKIDAENPGATFSPNGGTEYMSPKTKKIFVPIEITAQDEYSGVKKVEYIVSTSAETPTIDDENWQEYTKPIDKIENAQDEDKYYVYAKVTDDAGNVAVIKSSEYSIIMARATFDVGSAVNAKMKTLAGNENATHETADEKITSIVFNTEIPADKMTDAYKVSSGDSKLPIYMWPTTDPEDATKVVMNWYSEDETPYLNANASSMFRDLQAVTQIAQLNKIDTSKATTMVSLFKDCRALTSIDLSNFDTNQVKDMSYMFHDCVTLPTLDVSSLETQNVICMSSMFNGCSKLQTLNVEGFDTDKVFDFNRMFKGCSSLTSLKINRPATARTFFVSMQSMFSGCSGLTYLDVTGLNTQNVTSMQSMFSGCSELQTLNVEGFDTKNVTSFQQMFYGCSGLQSLKINRPKNGARASMESMFERCSGLTELDVSGLNTENVNNMRYMFYKCSTLENLDVSHFDTSSVGNLHYMFGYCRKLKSIDVSSFDTSKISSLSLIFAECDSLTTLDLRNFDTSAATTLYGMFYNCFNLKTIYASDLYVVNQGTDISFMFTGCSKLVGGNGTKFNASKIDGEYAWIDGKIDTNAETPGPRPGYFTNHYYIEFNKNDGTEPPVTAKQSIQIGVETELTEASTLFTREGFTFTGWNTESDGSGTAYTDKQKVIDIAALGETLTLYAQWSENNYLNTTTNTYYSTLTDALAEAKDGETVTVINSRTEVGAPTVAAGKAVTLNIPERKTVTLNQTMTVENTGTVTFTGAGTIQRTTGDLITNDGTVVVGVKNAENGATLKSKNNTINGGNVVINDGNIINDGASNAAIYSNTIEINKGNINSSGTYAILVKAGGRCDVKGGIITGNKGICPQTGTITISDDAQISTSNYAIGTDATWHSYTLEMSGGKISTTASSAIISEASNTNITITGGTITGATNGIKMTGANSTVTIGNSATAFNQISPSIQGDQYSIVVSGSGSTLNYYDGKLIGKLHDKTYDGREVTFNVAEANVTPRTGYKPYTRQNGDYYETVLEKELTVTADAGDGAISATDGWTLAQDGKTATKKVLQNTAYGTLPTKDEMERTGYTFKGWNGKNLFDESKFNKISDYEIKSNYYYWTIVQLEPNKTYKVKIVRYNGYEGKTNVVLLAKKMSPGQDGYWTSIAHTSAPNSSYSNFEYTTSENGKLYIGIIQRYDSRRFKHNLGKYRCTN